MSSQGCARTFAIVSALSALGCLDTGRERATIPLRVAGTRVPESVPGAGGWSVAIDRADLAFGPLYLCAGYQAGSLCDTARLEWTESIVVDGLDADSHDAGTLRGVTGVVRSWMYDLGITSLLTQERPLALPAAEELAGNSVVLHGVASRDPHVIAFRIEIPIRQEEATEIGVPVVRKSSSDRFQHDVTGSESALSVRFDPQPWVRDIDFESLVEDANCSLGRPGLVCAGVVELTCAEGSVTAERDCSELGMACLRGAGCTGEAHLTSDSQAGLAVRNALVAGERPEFEWSNAP